MRIECTICCGTWASMAWSILAGTADSSVMAGAGVLISVRTSTGITNGAGADEGPMACRRGAGAESFMLENDFDGSRSPAPYARSTLAIDTGGAAAAIGA